MKYKIKLTICKSEFDETASKIILKGTIKNVKYCDVEINQIETRNTGFSVLLDIVTIISESNENIDIVKYFDTLLDISKSVDIYKISIPNTITDNDDIE